MKIRAVFVPAFFCLFVASTLSQNSELPVASKKPSYEELIIKVKGASPSIDDFRGLRLAFVETKQYNPYGNLDGYAGKMFEAFEEKRFKDAAKAAEANLRTNFADLDSHLVAALAYKELGNAQKAGLHGDIYLGLAYSIMKGANGKTPERAFVVISTSEEYAMMRFLGYSAGSQSLVHQDGHSYDILSGIDKKTNETVKIYFNIDIVWKAETNMFKE